MNADQKERFVGILQQRFECPYSQLFASIQSLPESEKRGLFPELAALLGTTPRRVLDYYHNTWSRQFYQNPAIYRNEIREISLKYSPDLTVKEGQDAVFEEVESKFGGVFHRQALRQLIIKEYGRTPETSKADLSSLTEILASIM